METPEGPAGRVTEEFMLRVRRELERRGEPVLTTVQYNVVYETCLGAMTAAFMSIQRSLGGL